MFWNKEGHEERQRIAVVDVHQQIVRHEEDHEYARKDPVVAPGKESRYKRQFERGSSGV